VFLIICLNGAPLARISVEKCSCCYGTVVDVGIAGDCDRDGDGDDG
jgi:hypothetical protein